MGPPETPTLEKVDARLTVLPIRLLKAHEEIDEEVLKALLTDLQSSRVLRKATLVDRETYTILDGHHRVKALQLLGCCRVPCILVNYRKPYICVLSWKTGRPLSKNLILKASLSGKTFPPKTSKHMICWRGRMFHVSIIEPEVNVPLDELKK